MQAPLESLLVPRHDRVGRRLVPVRGRRAFAALQKATSVRSGSVRISFVAADGSAAAPPDQVRLSFVVSRRVGSAVVRNRIRRRIRDYVRTRPALPAGSYLVAVRPDAADASFAQLAIWVEAAMQRVSAAPSPASAASS